MDPPKGITWPTVWFIVLSMIELKTIRDRIKLGKKASLLLTSLSNPYSLSLHSGLYCNLVMKELQKETKKTDSKFY